MTKTKLSHLHRVNPQNCPFCKLKGYEPAYFIRLVVSWFLETIFVSQRLVPTEIRCRMVQ